MLYDAYGNEIPPVVKKVIAQASANVQEDERFRGRGKRGVTVYSINQLQKMTGRDKDGRLVSWGVERPYFYLTISQRIQMFTLSSPVFGVVASRMKRLSGLEFNITTEKEKEDETAQDLKDLCQIYLEYKSSTEISDLIMKARIYGQVKEKLVELKPDFSNFDNSLLRWKRRLKRISLVQTKEVKDWLLEPNNGVSWEEFVCKWVFDQMIHGCTATYKDTEQGRLANFDLLPGGTVFKMKAEYFSGVNGYIQLFPEFGYTGVGYLEPQVYYGDEIAYSEYLPTSSKNYPMIPLEALINKIAESLLFDKLMADQADGTKPPEKLIIVTEPNPFGSMDGENNDVPIDGEEQKRVENKINTPVKGSIMTFTGNRAEVLDISKENTMPTQMQRQKDIREEVALVFNMSNMEVNLTGSENTSGRATSESQAEIEQGKGIAPLRKTLTNLVQRQIIPARYGRGFMFEFEKSRNEREEKELDLISIQTGENTKNDIREKYSKPGYGPEFDKPDGSSSERVPGESEYNPMYTRSLM
jgi:hypothetical protein